MMRFNFLPWRESRRRQNKQNFNRLAVLCVTLGLAVVLLVFAINARKLATQAERNALLQTENQALDIRIREISGLRNDIEALRARQHAVETLQANRHQSVLLLDEITAKTPDGIMLKSLRQTEHIQLTGFALSNSRVSDLLRNLSQRPSQFKAGQPDLIEIKSSSYGQGKDVRKLFEFTLVIPLPKEQGQP